jgi:Predicted coiled-coil domain-containing protein (DUF2360)./Formin Homology 2 Domain.
MLCLQLWNQFQQVVGGPGKELKPLVEGSIQKEQARLSQGCKVKLQWIKNEATGSNRADDKQLVNDRELKKEKRETLAHLPIREEKREENICTDLEQKEEKSEIQVNKSVVNNVGQANSEKSSINVEVIPPYDIEGSSNCISDKESKYDTSGLGNQHELLRNGSPDARIDPMPDETNEHDNGSGERDLQQGTMIETVTSITDKGSETVPNSCKYMSDVDQEANVSYGEILQQTPLNQNDEDGQKAQQEERNTSLEEQSVDDCLKTPWPVKLRKVSARSKSPGSKSDTVKSASSQHIWPVKLKKTERKESSSQCNRHGNIEPKQFIMTPRQLHTKSDCLTSESSNGGHGSLITPLPNIEQDCSRVSPVVDKNTTTDKVDNLFGETIDLSQLPSNFFPQGSRTKIIPISNNKNTRPQVVAMGCELALIAQKTDEDAPKSKAKVLWFFYYKNVLSLNMLASCEDNIGAVGAEILVVDGPSYPLYFETFAVYMDFVQTFYNLKNNLVSSETENNSTNKEEKDVQTYDEKEWRIITMYREMLRRGTPKDAVSYQLDNKGVSKRIRDAIFINANSNVNDEKASFSIQRQIVKDSASHTKCQTPSSVHPLAEMIRNRARVEAGDCKNIQPSPCKQTLPNEESCDAETHSNERPTHPLASLIKSRAEEKDGHLQEQPESDPLPSEKDKHPSHPLAAMIKARSMENKTDESSDSKINNGNPIAAMIKARVNNNNTGGSVTKVTGPDETKSSLKENPKYAKYFQMLKIGLPIEVVKHALQRDGLDPNVLDGDTQNKGAVPLKDDPKYAKYFQMLKVGLCIDAVKNAMMRDGEDPSIMDGDHNLPAAGKTKQDASTKVPPKLQQKRVKDKFVRTRVFWDTLDDRIEGEIEKSVWGQKGAKLSIHIDEEDFRDKFQAEISKNAAKLTSPKNNQARKKTVQVIDEKRANNGGISLALLRGITFKDVANAVDNVDSSLLTIEQVAIVEQYLPTGNEKVQLSNYINRPGRDPSDLYLDLCECEKFMVTMKDIEKSKEKVKGIRFFLEFPEVLSDLQEYVRTIELACDELKKSQRFREILIFVLELGNKLNTAGREDTKKVSAITLFSINKLSETKAVDKKTTVLEFIVEQIVKQNESIASFRDDIPSVLKADSIDWNTMVENQYANIFSEVQSLKTIGHIEAVKAFLLKHDLHEGGHLLSNLQHKIKSTEDKFNRLTREYFLEKEKRVPHEWFANITTFTKDFYAAKKKVTNRLAAEEKKKRRNANKSDTLSKKRPEIRKDPIKRNLETISESDRLQDPNTEMAHGDQSAKDNHLHNWQPSLNDTPEVSGCLGLGLQVRLPLIPRRISFHDDKRTPVSETPEHHQNFLKKCQDHITADEVLPSGVSRSNSLESLDTT